MEQTRSALLSVRKLALNGEASQECVNLWGYLECSICDPKIGVQPGAPLICTYFFDRIFRVYSEAYFGRDTNSLDLAPCSPGELICTEASYLFSSVLNFAMLTVSLFCLLILEMLNCRRSIVTALKVVCIQSIPLGSLHKKTNPKNLNRLENQNTRYSNDASSQVKKKLEVFNKDAPSRVKKNKVFNEGAPSRVRKTFLDGKVYCGLGMMVLYARLSFLRRRDPNFVRIAAILLYKENPDGELKKKNKKSRKKKNR